MHGRYVGVVFLMLCQSALAEDASSIADAARNRDLAMVAALIARKTDVNVPLADRSTALQWAVYENDVKMADLLIGAGANLSAANREGATPLYLASLSGNALMIERLLRAGADPNERGPQGETPLMLASRSGVIEAMKALLAHKVDVDAREKLRGTTALMWATEQGHSDAVKLLIASGADVNAAAGPDTGGAPRNNLAMPVTIRLNSSFGANGGAGGGAGRRNQGVKDGGGLTPLVVAARQDCLDCARALVEAGANVNQVTNYGWTALLTATQNRHYKLAAYLLDHGANPNLSNKGGWSPLYLATDNRNIESGDYPVRTPDLDHLVFIELLLEKGADVNARICGSQSKGDTCIGDSTETRTNFTMQWLFEDGATPFLRAAQSGDVTLMKLLLAHGADPKIFTAHNVTPLAAAAGIGWVEGVTFEWSPEETVEAVKMCLSLGIDPNVADDEGRTSLHGAAHKGRPEVIQLLADHGANLEAHDLGSRDSINGGMLGATWIPLDWARGLVRVGVQSAIAHTDAEQLLVKLMRAKGLAIPDPPKSSICLTKGVNGCE